MENTDKIAELQPGESTAQTKLEFEFSQLDGDGFLFDSEADISPSYDKKEENTPIEEEMADTSPKEEFFLPDSFEVNEKYNTSSFVEDPLRVRTTYVPRFTEVSENYRMTRRTDGGRVKIGVKAEDIRIDKDKEQDIDPTAELDESEDKVEKVIVTSGSLTSSEPKDESISIFKFLPEVEKKEDEPREPDIAAIIEEAIGEAETEQTQEQESEEEALPTPDIIEEVREEEQEYTFETPYNEVAPLIPSGKGDAKSKLEYTSHLDRDDIKDRFLDAIMSIRVRLVASLVLLFVLSLASVLSLFGIDVMTAVGLGGIASANAVLDLQFVICLMLLALPEIVYAVKQTISKNVTPELFLLSSFIILAAYDAAMALAKEVIYPVFGVIYGVCVVCALFAAYFRKKTDFSTFKLSSRVGPKTVVDRRLTRELPSENMALDGAVDEYSSKTARFFRTNFVSDFFNNASKISENRFNVIMMLSAGLGLAFTVGVVCYFVNSSSFAVGFQSFALVYMLACPAFSLLIHKLPFSKAVSEALTDECAFIGEGSIAEYSDVDVLTYEDVEIFGEEDVSIRKVHLYGKAYNTAKAMRQMYSLFSVSGGPLNFVFSSSLDKKCESAEKVEIESDGVLGVFEGHKICAGTEEFMVRHNIRIPEDDYRTANSGADTTRIMYGAEDGEVYVKFHIRYSFSEEFTMLLPIFKEQGITPLVYTTDPNITNELVGFLTVGEELIRVLKKPALSPDGKKLYRKISSAAVTLGDKSRAVNMILLAKRYSAFQSGLALTELVSMIVGAAFGAVLSLGNMFAVPSVALALWQAAWCGVLYFRSKKCFGVSKSESAED